MSNSPFLFQDDDDNQPTMMGEDTASDMEGGEGEEEEEGEGDNNRTFMIAAVVIGAIVLLSLLCIAGFVFLNGGNTGSQQVDDANATIAAEATLVESMSQATMTALMLPTETPTETPVPSATPLLAPPNDTPTAPAATVAPEQATVDAINTMVPMTQTAFAATNALTPSVTALADTGFADEVGLPGLLIAAVILMIVILLARRMRETPTLAR